MEVLIPSVYFVTGREGASNFQIQVSPLQSCFETIFWCHKKQMYGIVNEMKHIKKKRRLHTRRIHSLPIAQESFQEVDCSTNLCNGCACLKNGRCHGLFRNHLHEIRGNQKIRNGASQFIISCQSVVIR